MPFPRRMIAHDGLTLSLKDWAARTGLHPETIRSRLDHLGYSVAAALAAPAQAKFRPRGGKSVAAPKQCPKLRPHSTGQAFVRWRTANREHFRYFGKWGTKGAVEAYRRFCVEWATAPQDPVPSGGLLVSELVTRYGRYVESYYVKDGRRTSEVYGQKVALRFLRKQCGDVLVRDVKGQHLKACQQAMIEHPLALATINQNTWRITRCFRWGVGEDLVPPDVAATLESVPNLQPGRTRAADRDPVMSVPLADVEATIPHLHADPGRGAVLEAMVRFQLLAGCRPGQLCAMAAGDIDRTGDVWCYRAPNKNLHRQARRRPHLVWIGPKARAILAPFLAHPGPNGRVWCFPARGKKGTVRTAVNREPFGEFVRLACLRAKVKPWHPHQLRHNRATEVQRLYEDDAAAAAVIGDTPDVARLVYADPNEAAARRIALATG